jgi:hypothetical protein
MSSYSIFNRAAPATTPTSAAGANGTNGLHFTVSQACNLIGLWHYSPSGCTQLPTSIGLATTTSTGTTSTIVTGDTNTSPSWSGAAGSGWVYAKYTSPIALAVATDYMALRFRNDATNEWFVYSSGVTWPLTAGIITVPNDTTPGQGWYNTGTALTAPTTQDSGFNWWMDILVETKSGTMLSTV